MCLEKRTTAEAVPFVPWPSSASNASECFLCCPNWPTENLIWTRLIFRSSPRDWIQVGALTQKLKPIIRQQIRTYLRGYGGVRTKKGPQISPKGAAFAERLNRRLSFR